MARILILTLVFRPDNVSTAQIMGDLALDLKAMGHDTFVITTVPHYNEDAEAYTQQPLIPFWGRLLQKSDYRGINVFHVWMPRKGKSKLLRIAAWLWFHFASTLVGMFSGFKPDVILAPSPPLTIGASAWLLGCWHKCPFIYNVQEIYPDVAINLGVLRNTFLISLLRKLELFVYDKASTLAVISESMGKHVLARVVNKDRVRVIPNFVDNNDFRPLSKVNAFSLRHDLHDKFVVSYAGNMGKPQGLDTLIDAAFLLRNESGIHFLLMGDGSERFALIEQARMLQLTNATFLEYQPYSTMAEAYASADVHFVSQALGTSGDGIPSKIYRIMACAKPVIVCTENDSDLARLVKSADSGIVVPAGDAATLEQVIRNAYEQQENWLEKGLKARIVVLDRYSRAAVCSQYNQLIIELARRNRHV